MTLEDTKTLKTIENKRTKDQSTNQRIQNREEDKEEEEDEEVG